MSIKPRYRYLLNQIPEVTEFERNLLAPVTDKYQFRTNDYYQSLINWDDPNDPIHRIIMPDVFENMEWGELDASLEEDYTVAPGCQHKYSDTALLLVNDDCGAYCRFCFRKRLFMDENAEVEKNVSEGLIYIRAHPEITNVLLTGGDPLIMSTRRLREVFEQLRSIDHVQIIRIGSKMPAFNPFRISDDPELLEVFSQYSTPERRIYVMAHFNHPTELTEEAILAKARLADRFMSRLKGKRPRIGICALNPHAGEGGLFGEEERTIITPAVQRGLAEGLHTEGANLGMNIGRAAGAGIDDHVHLHIVPRWSGDTNYMTAIANARVVPQLLEESAEQLRPLIQEAMERFQ